MLGGAELPALWAAVFVAALAESALHFVSWSKLEDELETQAARTRYLRYLEHTKSISALCVLVRIGCTVLLAALVAVRARQDLGYMFGAVMATLALLIAAELTARLIGRRWSSGVLHVVLPHLYWLSVPLRPLQVFGWHPAASEDDEPEPEVVEAAKEEIRVALEDGTAEGALEAEEKHMIEGILKFRDVDVAEIVTPRTEIECLEAEMPLREALRALARFRHSRIPVFEGTLDNVVGVVYVKDLVATPGDRDADQTVLRDVMREPFFIPETKTVGPLLQEFQNRHVQIAVVLDEYGGVSGVVTVEDIMEEIVGEIQDEYDQEDHENRIRVNSSGGFEVDARVRIDELNELLGLDIPDDEDYDTVGGFVTAYFARVPTAGEEFQANGLLVRIVQSDKRRVRRVMLKRYEKDQPQP